VGGTTAAFIGLGANVGDARATMERAIHSLAALDGVRLVGVSRLYRTKPVGDLDQPDFLNAVAEFDVPSGPDPVSGATGLLVELKRLERELGRQERRRWGPREIDLDLLLFGDAHLAVDRPADGVPASAALDPGGAIRLLEVPHPSMRDRLFVLAPMVDLAPDLVPPGWSDSVAQRRRMLEDFEPGAIDALSSWRSTSRGWG
jgi:2-amino-4-hydroxy-6-hydroxymethyldihydropteridine diphosphokinase